MLAAHTLVPWLPVAAVKSKAYRPFKLAFEDVPVIMTDALALLALSVMELAMMTTCPPQAPLWAPCTSCWHRLLWKLD